MDYLGIAGSLWLYILCYAVLPTFHDIYVILFFYPLIYLLRGVMASGLVFLGILLPHALLFTHETYSLVRSLLFALFAFLISGYA